MCVVTCELPGTAVEVGLARLRLWEAFTPLILSRQGIVSELGVSVFVCSGSCVFVVFLSSFSGLAWSLCPSYC